MTDKTEQTAVDETKAPAQPGAAVDGAQQGGDDLDKLLADFDAGTKTTAAPTTQPEQKAGAADDHKALADEVRQWRTERQQEVFNRDMGATVEKVRGDLDPDIFDSATVRGYINARADEDPRLAQAWINRHANPKAFDRVVEKLGQDFRKKFSRLPDKQATEDREAVTAAVRGASTKAPEGPAPDVSRMTPNEFQAYKDKLFGT